jgi:hypothetical protein
LPETKYRKIVFLIGEASWDVGSDVYPSNNDVVAVFRDYCIDGRYDNKLIYPIPSGYNCRSNGKVMVRMYPEKRLSERKYDVFFSGQKLSHRTVLVNKLAEYNSSFNIMSQATPSFRQGMGIDDYYKTMGDSKICVVPDGTSIDTYRFTEALGSGCAVITTPKPDLWYYKGAPVFYVKDWDGLTKEHISNILGGNLDVLQETIREYYDEHLSARAVANYIIKILQTK